MSNLNNKHLPSDIDSLTRKDLVEIYHIQVEEHQKMIKRIAELEAVLTKLNNLGGLGLDKHQWIDYVLNKGGDV